MPVVYNEMKGAYSSPDGVLERAVGEALFPGHPYAEDSGGDPDRIPDLTYEDYLEFHSRYYHPSNSYIYLYGDTDMAEQLRYIDEAYLSSFERREPDSVIPVPADLKSFEEHVCEYSLSESESVENAVYYSWNVRVGAELDPVRYNAFQALSYVLMEVPGAPLHEAVINAGLGDDVYGGYANGIREPYFTVTVKNSADTEDILQLTFIKAWQNITKLNDPRAFNTWLQRIALNESKSMLRKKRPDLSVDDEGENGEILQFESDLLLPQEYAERDDLSARLRKIIEELSVVQRDTILLFYYNEMSVEEIAQIMDCSEGTVKSRLFLARKAIKTEIEEQERKSGAKFYGVPLLPFGAIFSRQISKSAIAPARAAQLYSGICAAASPAAAASVATSMAAGTKVLIGVLAGVIAVGLVAAGIIAATLIGKQQNNSPSAWLHSAYRQTQYIWQSEFQNV